MALETTLTQLIPELRAYAISLAADRTAAEDMVQDALERALKSRNRPKKIKDLRPWMFRTIRNLYYDELRKLRVRREYAEREGRFSTEGNAIKDPAQDVLVRMAFDRLPAEKKEVLFLVDVMGLKYAEAAEVMGVAIGTVMSRVSRARQALLMVVDEGGFESVKRVGSTRK
jgi:RNA polymerase sigma-70 factor, ECF subfamily